MTAHEKAVEIYNKFYENISHYGQHEDEKEEDAKNYALSCIDFILKENSHYQDLVSVWQDDENNYSVIERQKYWQEVKEEIKNL